MREITRAAVAVPPGTGDVDTLVPACRGGTLAVFVLRGHVLSRVTRPLDPGAGFGTAVTLATGADALGPVSDGAVDGPVAWHSPLAGLDESEREDLWAAVLDPVDGGAPRVVRGDVLLPAGVAGMGVPVPAVQVDGRVEALAAIARPGEAPTTARIAIVLGRDGAELASAGAPGVVDGELRAWEPVHGRVLARVRTPSGDTRLSVSRPGGAVAWVTSPLPEVLVIPRGVSVGDASVFLAAGFAVGGDGGRCVDVGGLCVHPGPLGLLVSDGSTLRRVQIAPEGLPDAVTAQTRDTGTATGTGTEVTVLYVDGAARQCAARVDIATGAVRTLTLTPPEGMPAIDHPTLVTCDDGPWLVAELSLPRPDGGTSPAVTALPLECLAR